MQEFASELHGDDPGRRGMTGALGFLGDCHEQEYRASWK